jgi:hypothetical protein
MSKACNSKEQWQSAQVTVIGGDKVLCGMAAAVPFG